MAVLVYFMLLYVCVTCLSKIIFCCSYRVMLTWQKTELLILLIAFFSFTQHYNLNYINKFAKKDDVVLLCGKNFFVDFALNAFNGRPRQDCLKQEY